MNSISPSLTAQLVPNTTSVATGVAKGASVAADSYQPQDSDAVQNSLAELKKRASACGASIVKTGQLVAQEHPIATEALKIGISSLVGFYVGTQKEEIAKAAGSTVKRAGDLAHDVVNNRYAQGAVCVAGGLALSRLLDHLDIV